MKEPEQIDRAKILRLAELVREHAEQSYNAERPLQFSEMALISRSCDEIGREISKQTEQPERHGSWDVSTKRNILDELESLYICSECECLMKYKTNFCPRCGAQMDGGQSSGKD